MSSFWCAAVAAMTLKFLNPFGNGSIVLFAVTYTKEYHYWEFPIFLVLGVFGVSFVREFKQPAYSLGCIWRRFLKIEHHLVTQDP